MALQRKINYSDPGIKIRIIKALADEKPFGYLRHFIMIRIIRGMKKPNVISNLNIWTFINENYEEERYVKREGKRVSFDEIFNND